MQYPSNLFVVIAVIQSWRDDGHNKLFCETVRQEWMDRQLESKRKFSLNTQSCEAFEIIFLYLYQILAWIGVILLTVRAQKLYHITLKGVCSRYATLVWQVQKLLPLSSLYDSTPVTCVLDSYIKI